MMVSLKTVFRDFLIALVLLSMLLPAGLFTAAKADSSAPVIYVSPTGSDTDGNGTSLSPYLTLSKAFGSINGKVGATVVLMGDVQSTNSTAWNDAYKKISGHTATITITGKDPVTGTVYENARLRYDSPILEGPVVIEYLSLYPSRSYSFIDTAGYKLTLGQGVTNENFDICFHDGINPGAGLGVVSGTESVIESGNISSFYMGGGYPTSTEYGVAGDCRLTVNGGSISTLFVGFDRYNETHTTAFIDGNVIITVNGGSVNSILTKQLTENSIGGFYAVIANNGVMLPSVADINAKDGSYIINSGVGGSVSATDQAGVFAYEAQKDYVCYVNGTPAQGGFFAVEPGTYAISFKRPKSGDYMGAYIEGFEDKSFRPDEKLTRAQAVQLVLKAAGKENAAFSDNVSYSDVLKSDWYFNAVAYMEENEALPAQWAAEFLPNKYITRGEFLYIVDCLLVKHTASIKLPNFSDISEDSTPYYDAIMAAALSGCVNGYGDGTFRPEESLSRAEAVTVLNRYLSRTPKDGVSAEFDDVHAHWACGQIVAAASDFSENKWTYTESDDAGVAFVMPKGGKSAKDYITSLYAQSANLSGKAIRDASDVIAEQMKKDILNTPNTLEIYSDRITRNIYYVSESGNDSTGTGTLAKPFRSHAGVASKVTLRAGDAVLFERGGVYRGRIVATPGVVYGSYGEGNKPLLLQSAKNYADPSLWKKTEWENVWVCTDLLTNVGVIGFDHDMQDYSENTYNELYGITMNKDLFGFQDPSQLCGDLQFYSELGGSVTAKGNLYVYSKDGNPGERFDSIEIGEKIDIIDNGSSTPNGAVFDNLSLKFTGGHGIGFGTTSNLTVTNCIFSWLGGSVLSLNFHGTGRVINYGNAVEIYGGCDGYTVENNWMYQVYDTAVTHQRSSSTGDCIQTNIRYAENLMEYVYWGIEFYNSPPSASQLEAEGKTEDTYTRYTSNVASEYNLLRLGGYGWGSIVRHRGSSLYCGSTLSDNYDCYAKYNIFDRAYGDLLTLPANSNEVEDCNIYIQHIGQPLGKLKETARTMCDYLSVEKLSEKWGDENAVVVIIDPSLDPIVRNFPEGWIASDALVG